MSVSSIKKNIRGDKVIWAVVILLSVFSILAVYSSTGTLAYRFRQGNTEYYLIKHLSILGLGLVLMYLTHLIPYHFFGRLSKFAIIAVLPLLAFTLLYGVAVHGAYRWYILPVINISFQPSDIAKLALIVYLAYTLARMQDNISQLNNMLVRVLLPMILVVMLVLPANLSTAAIIFATSLIIMFVGRVSLKHLGAIVGGTMLLFLVFISVIRTNTEIVRFQTWERRVASYVGSNDENNYQIEQSKIAIASGGITGKLPGNSTQKNFLPQSFSDFIFAIIIEEYGLLGGGLVVLLYLILLFRGIRIATKSTDTFGALLTFGLMFSLVFQAMINMGVTVGLMPVTGQPLPMVSMGGTSLWFTSIAIGIVLSVSRSLENDGKNKMANARA